MSIEDGITNLGPVPPGMTFQEATRAMRPKRKYEINPHHQTRRLTICETLREIYRVAATCPEPQRSQLTLLAGAGFDFAKRMNRRMIDLKAKLPNA
jgi:hypothetical protein